METQHSSIPVKLNLSNFIAGKFATPSAKTFPVVNPATEEQIAVCSEASVEEVDQAVAAAKRAFYKGIDGHKAWKDVPGAERKALLKKLAELMQRDLDIIAKLNSIDLGAPMMASKALTMGAIAKLDWCAATAERITGETVEPKPNPDGSGSNLFSCSWRQPFGVVAGIAPWNIPAVSFVVKVGAAVACGNTIVYKDSEKTPLAGAYLAQLSAEAGFPPGVINVIHGHGVPAGEALSLHMDVRMITFTGSCVTGKAITANSGRSNLKKVCLELGGKSAAIVFEDADLPKAIQNAFMSFTRNSGQVCAAHTRVYAHESILDQFVDGLKQYAARVVPGDPMLPDTRMGPLVDSKQYDRVKGYLAAAQHEAQFLQGTSNPVKNKGYYIQPTILVPNSDDVSVVRDEIFGPVVCVMPFKTEEEVLARVNDTEFGLHGGIYTTNLSKALRVSREMEVGTVGINTGIIVDDRLPFGGWKQSGSGRENGTAFIEDFTELKTVHIAY